MAHLIDKSALVAEIQKRISLFKKEKKTEKWSAEASQMNVISLGARIAMLEEIISFIDTIEVKDVGVDLGSPDGDKSAKYIIDTKTLEVKEVDLEKDSLTWKDINLIDHLLFDIKEDYDNCKLDKEEYYKEVLKKFKAQL